MVGITGFEPVTSRPPGARATKLRYIPTNNSSILMIYLIKAMLLIKLYVDCMLFKQLL